MKNLLRDTSNGKVPDAAKLRNEDLTNLLCLCALFIPAGTYDASDAVCAADDEVLAGLEPDLCGDPGRLVVGLWPDLAGSFAVPRAVRAGRLAQLLLSRERLQDLIKTQRGLRRGMGFVIGIG